MSIATAHQPTTLPQDPVYPFLMAHFALREGVISQARQAMQQAINLCQQYGRHSLQVLNQDIVTELLSWSYAQGIEPDFVQASLDELSNPPTRAPHLQCVTDRPIRISTLGHFSIQVDRHALAVNRLNKSMPMELLKVVITLGGRQISCEKVAMALWPSAEGDCARNSLNTTLHRLRKQLNYPNAILLCDGALSLDTALVQLDTSELEQILDRLEAQFIHSAQDPGTIKQNAQRLLACYRGHFLEFEHDRSWAVLYRERLKQRVIRAMLKAAKLMHTMQYPELAIQLLYRALELDPLYEAIYQELMQILIDLDRRAEAASLYKRCRQVLASKLGVMPASETLRLYTRLTRAIPSEAVM